jgi:hypothetical protein
MQKILIVVLSVVFFSCHADDKKEPDSKGAAPGVSATLPYTAAYLSKFEMGVPKNAEAILAAWKSWDDGDLKTPGIIV